MKKKRIAKRMTRKCEVCGGEIKVTVYSDGTYAGGNYFTPLFLSRRRKKSEESWECEKCWGPN